MGKIQIFPWYCEHGELTSACSQCTHSVRVANHRSEGGWEQLIKTKERQYASADELAMRKDND